MLGILRRAFSFADWNQHHPAEPPPGDMLDASFDAQNQRIEELDALVSQLIRSDGALANASVGADSLKPELIRYFEAQTSEKARETIEIARNLIEEAQKALAQALEARIQAVSASGRAEIAKTEAEDAKSAVIAQKTSLETQISALRATAKSMAETRTDWDDAESYAQAWADSSRLWAEHMPDTLPDNALKIMDITGDHWSSRWWANQAANAFGMMTSLYLGAHPVPPLTNNNGGPIAIGSIYYNTESHQTFVWTGSQWESLTQPQRAGLMTLWYEAAGGQTIFPLTSADLNGSTFSLTPSLLEGVDAHVNGIKVMPKESSATGDWTLDGSTSTVTFLRPLRAGDLVSFDILMPEEALGPGAVQAWVLAPLTGKDGTAVTFALSTREVPGVPVTVVKYEELLVSLDGVIQEPGVSYTASGASITFAQAPGIDSYVFIVWFRPEAGGGIVSGGSVAWADITGKPSTFPPTLPIAQSGVTNLVTDLSGKAPTVHTHAQADVTGLVTALAAKEPVITAGTTSQYWRGDKSWQTLTIPADDVIGGIITISNSAPSSPSVGDVWIDTT
jgi:hypothetical protein